MNWRQWLEDWQLSSLKLSAGILDAEFRPNDVDREAAWELYVELLTRVATQPLDDEHGDENIALSSVYGLFGTTREILRRKGPNCIHFTKLAIVVLNQIVRPFTAKWHQLSLKGAFDDKTKCAEFRSELRIIQLKLQIYTRALSGLACVEDLTELEPNEPDPTTES